MIPFWPSHAWIGGERQPSLCRDHTAWIRRLDAVPSPNGAGAPASRASTAAASRGELDGLGAGARHDRDAHWQLPEQVRSLAGAVPARCDEQAEVELIEFEVVGYRVGPRQGGLGVFQAVAPYSVSSPCGS